MTDYGYWTSDHSEVTVEELEEHIYNDVDAQHPPISILGSTYTVSDLVRAEHPYSWGSFIDMKAHELRANNEILTDEEMQEHIDTALHDWADSEVMPVLPEAMQEQIDEDSERYAWAIGELESSGILEYIDKDTIDIHAHYTLDYVINYVIDFINE